MLSMFGASSASKKPRIEKSEESKNVPDNGPISGVIRLEVDKVSTLDNKGRLSPEVYIGGLPWRGLVRAVKRNGEECIIVHLCSLDIKSAQWSIDVQADFILSNADSSKNLFRNRAITFNPNCLTLGVYLLDRKNLIDENEGFIKDNILVVEIRLSIVNMKGIWIQPRFDASPTDGKDSKIGVLMDGKLVAVDKQSLFSAVKKWYGSDTAAQDENSSGFISWEIVVSDIDIDFIPSPAIEVHDMQWSLMVRKLPDSPHLELYIVPPKGDSNIWSVDVLVDLFLVNTTARRKTEIKLQKTTFNHECGIMGSPKFILWDDLINEEKGFVKDGKITLEARIHFTNMVGIRTIPRIDFADPSDPRHDVTLLIEGKKVHAGKQILAFHSPVFNTMFFGRFVERTKKEIELKEINRKEFIEMLNLIYPSYQKITEDNAESLLRLADRFQIKMVTDQVEQFLIGTGKLDILSKLNLSVDYRLIKLQDHCLASFTTVDDIMNLKTTPGYNDLSAFAKSALLDKAMKLR